MTRRRRLTLRQLLQRLFTILALALFVYFVVVSVGFILSRDNIPSQTQLADADIGGKSVDEAISITIESLNKPVTLLYLDNAITLQPSTIDFRVDDVSLATALQESVDKHGALSELGNRLMRVPITPTVITAPYSVNEEKLQGFLTTIAQQYDQPAVSPKPDLDTLQIGASQSGVSLNISEARSTVLRVLTSSVTRTVHLPIDVIPPGELDLQTIEPVIRQRLNDFASAGNIAGVFIKDLRSGVEFAINGDVAFSARGWLRWAIALEGYRLRSQPVNADFNNAAQKFVSEGGSPDAALVAIGNGDAQAGVNQLNDTLKRLGLQNTFLAQPFSQSNRATNIVTPANSRGDVNASPDPNAQTTPAEIGVLLETLDQCRENRGALLLAFSSQFDPSKCQNLLDVFARNRINALIESNSGGSTVIHRQSWDDFTHGDAALVRSPNRDYVLVVVLNSKNKLEWSQTSAIIGDIARMTFALFNNKLPPASSPPANPPPQ
jgi:hypothetical protein